MMEVTEALSYPTVLKRESVPQAEINKTVGRVARFFDLPPEMIHRGASTEILTVDTADLAKLLEGTFKSYLEYKAEEMFIYEPRDPLDKFYQEMNLPQFVGVKLSEFRRWRRDPEILRFEIAQLALDVAQDTNGVFVTGSKRKRVIYLNSNLPPHRKKSTQDHELIHSMATEDLREGTGLVVPHPLYDLNIPLNEAATEILRLAALWEVVSPRMLLDRANLGEIESSYLEWIKDLLLVMYLADNGKGKPVTVHNLAKYYFSSSKDRDLRFVNFLVKNTPLEYQQMTSDTLLRDLA